MEGDVICEGVQPSFISGLAALLATYYVFNLEYQEEGARTLEFVQRRFIGVNPERGTKASQGKVVSKKTGKRVQKKAATERCRQPICRGHYLISTTWTPCDGCWEEFEKILREKQQIEEVLLKIDPDQVRVLQTLCDLVSDKYSDSPPQQSGQQELFPESGVFMSSFRLAAMSHASKPNCMRLFHTLFDHFFLQLRSVKMLSLLVALETSLQEQKSASLTGKKLKKSELKLPNCIQDRMS
ncbi:uncharacterized protein [Nerophis lumbriciformis]|uniref:uncharacterized protein n=1 Tax=Nerophis lumbriciformis TaxID=546530 RepID=UPI003BAC6209